MKQFPPFKAFFSILLVTLTVLQGSWAYPVATVPSSNEEQLVTQQKFTAVAFVEEVAPQLSAGLEFHPCPFTDGSFTTTSLSKIASQKASHFFSICRAQDIQHRLMVQIYPFHAFW